jgi:hypothetical protein
MASNTPVARVSALQGKAFARGEDGAMRELMVGDPIFEGDVVVALPGAQVDLAADDGRSLILRDNETLTVDAEVFGDVKPDASVDELLEETAAGIAAGGTDGGPTFVRLLRIAEGVDPLNYEFDMARRGQGDELGVSRGLRDQRPSRGP